MSLVPPSEQPGESDIRAAKLELVRLFLRQAVASSAARLRPRMARMLPGPARSGNLIGVGIGDKVVLNQLTGGLCVKFYVRRKYPTSDIPQTERIPDRYAGIPTDVEEVGMIGIRQLACSRLRQQRQRPCPAGVSIGPVDGSAGTIGAIVVDRHEADRERRYILSNHHVLAAGSTSVDGDVILQPGPVDGGSLPDDAIGRLTRSIAPRFGGADNVVDAAIAEVAPETVLSEICSIGNLRGTVRPTRDMVVVKHGRTTGLTKGIISDTDADFRIDYPGSGEALFLNVVVIRGLPPTTPFSDSGDSGALIVDGHGRACGLLFAGSDTKDLTFANPIQLVLRRLRVRLL